MRFFILSTLMSKRSTTESIVQSVASYRLCENEDEARGAVQRKVMENHPGFSISSVGCMELTVDEIRDALVRMEGKIDTTPRSGI